MQTLIIKSIHEHGFGFAFTKDEHDQVFLPKKLLADFEHLDWLEPADEVYAKIIPNYKDKLDGGCKYVCTYITIDRFDPVYVASVREALGEVIETICPTKTPFVPSFEPTVDKGNLLSELNNRLNELVIENKVYTDRIETISAINNLDELSLKIFLFHNLESSDPYLYKLLFSTIEQGFFPNRVWGCLNYMVGNSLFSYSKPERNKSIRNPIYFYDVILRSDKFFLNFPNFGKKSLSDLKSYLSEFGLQLNTDLKDIKYETLKSFNLHNKKNDYLFVKTRGIA